MADETFVILLVDDDADDVELTRQMLLRERPPLELPSAPNGLEALAFLRREGVHAQAPRPDLILLDLNMPVMDGRDFLSVVKGDPAFKSIPVVILTTARAGEEIVASYGLGANGYVNKPMDLDQFAEVARVVEDFRQARAASRRHL